MSRIKAPVYGFYAGNDARIGATLPDTTTQMKAAGKTFDPVVYEGAGHVDYHIDRLPLSPGVYSITAAAHDSHAMTVYDRADDIVNLHVQPGLRPVRGVVGWRSWRIPRSRSSSSSSSAGGAPSRAALRQPPPAARRWP